jgi:hypothetical protein
MHIFRLKVFLRLGEGLSPFDRTPITGHLINDTDLADLEIWDSGLCIRFNWNRTFDFFFREEMMMRDHQSKLVAAAIANLKSRDLWSNDAPLVDQIRTLLPVLVSKIQHDRRFHVQMHRSLRHDSSAQTMSNYLIEPIPLEGFMAF